MHATTEFQVFNSFLDFERSTLLNYALMDNEEDEEDAKKNIPFL